MVRKPDIIKAIGFLFLAGGLWAIGWSILVATTCCWLFWIAELLVGIVAIAHAGNMLAASETPPSRFVSVLLILCVLNFDLIAMTVGIVTLVFAGHANVRAYYRARGVEY